MSIREKRTSISQFAAALRQRSSQDKRDLLVADTLDSLCRHCDLYDAARVSSNPFHPELLRAIAAADFPLMPCSRFSSAWPSWSICASWPTPPSRWTTRKRSYCSSSSTAGNGCLTT